MWAVFCESEPMHFHPVYFTVRMNDILNACLCSEQRGRVKNNLCSAGNELSVASFCWVGPLEEVCVYLCVCVSIVLLWWIRMLLMAASLINCVFELAPLPRDRSQDSNETHIHIRRAHGNLLVLCSSTSKPSDQASHLLWLYPTASPCSMSHSINTFYISHKHINTHI